MFIFNFPLFLFRSSDLQKYWNASNQLPSWKISSPPSTIAVTVNSSWLWPVSNLPSELTGSSPLTPLSSSRKCESGRTLSCLSHTAVWPYPPCPNHLVFPLNSLTSNFVSVVFCLLNYVSTSELSRFIAAGRLNCVIDKVNGVVLTNKVDLRTEQYQAVLKHGDQIVNKLQKLGRVISY